MSKIYSFSDEEFKDLTLIIRGLNVLCLSRLVQSTKRSHFPFVGSRSFASA
ncbi:MAG TPA: hypothetical protein PK564_02980 [bacterium]|nr:hypothetical protein [bacterium]